MSVTIRTVETERDLNMAVRLVKSKALPFTLSLTPGKHRSTAQNRLQFMWFNEIAQQKGDATAGEVRAYCKLRIGIPILRAQNESFRSRYDAVLKDLPYDKKLALMEEPLNMPVTSLMTVKQKKEYLDEIQQHFGEQGIILTIPDDIKNELHWQEG